MSDDRDRDLDRDRGILTPSDRKFLIGDRDDYEESSIRQKWYRIVNRVRNSIQDFTLLFETLPPNRLGQIFYPGDRGDADRSDIYQSMRAGLALFFLQQYEEPNQMDLPESWNVPPERFFFPQHRQNRLVERGLRRALESRGEQLHEYEYFEYKTEPLNLENLWRRYQSGEPLTMEEFETLQREATTADIQWQARVVNESAFSENEEITHDDEVLLPRDRHLIWNRSLDENEEKTDPLGEDGSTSEEADTDSDAN